MSKRDTPVKERLEKVLRSPGATPREKRKKLFEIVRDIPYALQMDRFSVSLSGKEIKDDGDFCLPKHSLLADFYLMLDTEIKWRVYDFEWKSLPFEWKDDFKQKVDLLPTVYHVCLMAKLKGAWAIVDATWDKGLCSTGLPVNLVWDGETSMRLAVSAETYREFKSPEKLEENLKERMSAYSLSDKLKLARFSVRFNRYLRELRVESPVT